MTKRFKTSGALISAALVMLFGFTAAAADGMKGYSPVIDSEARAAVKAAKRDVMPGNWGGVGVSVIVEKNSVTIGFDCGSGQISRSFKTTKAGVFKLSGTYTPGSHGPIRINMLPKPGPAIFSGRIAGKKMTLKVTLTDTNEVVGDFTLERGKEAKLHRCM